jgi:hypothetical protein
MSKFKLLREKFGKNKRLTKLVAIRAACPLGFRDLLVYSTLLYRGHQRGQTKYRLARHTGIQRTRTLPAILDRLLVLGLADNTDGRWAAVVPGQKIIDEWFVAKGDAVAVVDRLRYNWIMVPDRAADSPLTSTQAAVLAMLVQGHTDAAVARFLRVSVRTVARTRKQYPSIRKDWFQDRGKVAKKVATRTDAPTVATIGQTLTDDKHLADSLDRAAKIMVEANYRPRQVETLCKKFTTYFSGDRLFYFLCGFSDWFHGFNNDHLYKVRQGEIDRENSYGLAVSMFDRYLKKHGINP